MGVRQRYITLGRLFGGMSSSATGSTERDAGDGTEELPVTLDRTVERLDQGIVVTYELTTETDAPAAVDLTQTLPAELAVADVGFRTDAAPAEWSVDEETVHGTGTAPVDGTVEYVLGLKLPEAPDRLPTFPEPELSAADAEMTDPEAAPDGTVSETTGTDADSETQASETTEAPADEGDEQEDDDGPALVGNTDGALAESVRQVIESDSGETDTTRTTATDGGSDTVEAATGSSSSPTPRGTPEDTDSGLEAAVAAVESELEDGEEGGLSADEDTADEEPPELDLSPPDQDAAETDDEPGAAADSERVADERDETGEATDADGATLDPSDDTGTAGGSGAAGAPAGAGAGVDELADRLAAADDADRRAVRSALGLGEGTSSHEGTVTVRLEQLESRLSAFEAYEDALADFIEDTGTVESVEATASEAAAAAEDLRAEVADLRDEVAAARESVEEASEERAALREDVDALRDEVDEALGLRQQLLGALQDAGGAGASGAEAAGSGQ
jgi:soluble cytochrome b562